MKRLIILLILFCHCTLFAAPLKIGVLKYAPPFSVESGPNGQYYGFIIELMDAICRKINQECAYVGTPLINQYTLLDKGTIDLSFASDPIVSTKSGNYVYSLPYITSNVQFLTLSASPINSIEDIKNKRIGVMKITLYNLVKYSKFGHYGEIKKYENMSNMLNGLMNKDIDVILINYNYALYIKNNTSGLIKLVGDKIVMGNGYGIAALNSQAPLIEQINKALLSMQEDGSYLKIYNTYFGK